MKKLMENWKKYLTENKEEYLKSLGLHITKKEGEYTVYLYEWNTKIFRSRGGWPWIVGTLGTMKMDDQGRTPCIPTTQEVGSSAVREQRKGRGIGTHMYEVVAYYMKMEQDGGITSDHSASTTKDAARVWAKLRDKLNYVKRKTPKGPDKETFNPKTGEVLPAYKGENDEFDYNDSTPDPQDDCYEPTEGRPASPNSLQIPAARMGYIAKLIEIQLDNFDKMMTKAKEFDIQDVESDGAALFSREYDPYISGIYGGDKGPTKNQKKYYSGERPVFENWKRYLDEEQLDEKLMLKKGKMGWWKYSQLVAEAYRTAPKYDAAVEPLYFKLGKWLEKEYGRMTSRIKIEFVPEHPYTSAKQMRQRVKDEGVMYVSTSDAEHPVWKGKQGLIWNTMFRAWHDWQGHIEKGRGFRLQGEIAAYNHHAKMIPQDCVPILFTEVVGQICCFYQSGKKNCIQKAMIMPEFDHFRVGELTLEGEERFKMRLNPETKLLEPIDNKETEEK